jgi:conjugal transfer/entry exclusion protein
MKKPIGISLIVIFMSLSNSALAGGSGIVFDPTNFVQNTITALESVAAEAQRASQVSEALRQSSYQMKGLTTLNGALQAANLSQFGTQYQNYQNYFTSLESLYGSVSSVKSALGTRFNEQKLSGLSSSDYSKAEADRIARGNTEAIDRAARNKQLLENVNTDYSQVRSWQDQIGGTVGTVDSMQLMNTQLNRLVAQNNQIIQSLAEKGLSDEYAKTEALAKKNAGNDAEQSLIKMQQTAVTTSKTEIDALDAKSKSK